LTNTDARSSHPQLLEREDDHEHGEEALRQALHERQPDQEACVAMAHERLEACGGLVRNPPQRLRPAARRRLEREAQQQPTRHKREGRACQEHRGRAAETEEDRCDERAEKRTDRVEQAAHHVCVAEFVRRAAQPGQ
jgi:hypothetical protein